jgi:hypothetical protein
MPPIPTNISGIIELCVKRKTKKKAENDIPIEGS